MKLPRYLQLALVLTAGAVFWSQFADDEISQAPLEAQPVSRPRPAPAKPETAHATRIDLFQRHIARRKTQQNSRRKTIGLKRRHQPHRRYRFSSSVPVGKPSEDRCADGWQRDRPVCERCRADGRIWIGSSPVNNWILKAVANDHLLFEWQPTHSQQRLELDELQSEPTH